jgi:hypothetical protein
MYLLSLFLVTFLYFCLLHVQLLEPIVDAERGGGFYLNLGGDEAKLFFPHIALFIQDSMEVLCLRRILYQVLFCPHNTTPFLFLRDTCCVVSGSVLAPLTLVGSAGFPKVRRVIRTHWPLNAQLMIIDDAPRLVGRGCRLYPLVVGGYPGK